ncbi:HD domain-containing protein [Shouchella patagoniensis]|uniref:HD domain-containing protein n=1 Tax=Shouchella patagoniensis TaxID=228576 RepID=UPI000994FC40|nr:HD domain-containing protein [Shouchella patagoniensis]
MRICDEIYGTVKLSGVLGELMNSQLVQRLKGIHQGGASYLVNPTWNVTRFDHSVGVMMLVKKLGGTEEEQIASLLHDVSHTAFSHVSDLVFDHKNEDYHEFIYEQMVASSSIPTILRQEGMDWKKLLLDDSKWTLLEQSAPELCADRVDYTLRDMYTYGKITLEEVHWFLAQLAVVNGRMFCTDLFAAEWFVETYYKEVIGFFMDPLNIYGYDRLALVLKRALAIEVISKDDFLKEDNQLIAQLSTSDDHEIQTLLNELSTSVQVEETLEESHIHRKTKVRLINPSIVKDGSLVPASTLSKRIRLMNEAAKVKAEKGVSLKVHD